MSDPILKTQARRLKARFLVRADWETLDHLRFARSYGEYVEDKKSRKEKPLSKGDWESRKSPSKDKTKGNKNKTKSEKGEKGEKNESKGGKPEAKGLKSSPQTRRVRHLLSKANAVMRKAWSSTSKSVQVFMSDPVERKKMAKDMRASVVKGGPQAAKAMWKGFTGEVKAIAVDTPKILFKLAKEKRRPNKSELHTLYGVGVYAAGTALAFSGAFPLLAAGKAFGHSITLHAAFKAVGNIVDEIFLGVEAMESAGMAGGLSSPLGTGDIPGLNHIWDYVSNIGSIASKFGAEEGPSPKSEEEKFLADLLQKIYLETGRIYEELDDSDMEVIMAHGMYPSDSKSAGYSGEMKTADMSEAAAAAMMRMLSDIARRTGAAKHIYVVGGAVRNFVLKHPVKDIDVVIDSIALGKDSEWFANMVAKAIPAKTNVVTDQYGVSKVFVLSQWDLAGFNMRDPAQAAVEIANARSEIYGGAAGKGYKPDSVEPATIEQDILRRDFSFNTLMWSLLELAKGQDKAEILDLTGCGLKDLQERRMRCPADPDKTFSDDPSRMLRAVKFIVKYGMKLTPDTEAAIKRNLRKLRGVPYEKIAEILESTLLKDPSTAKKALPVMKRLGLLDVIADWIREDRGFRSRMTKWVNSKPMLFLFDLMDLGLPLGANLSFLDWNQQTRLRQVALGMPEGVPERYLDVLRQPGKSMDTRTLIQEFGLRGRGISDMQKVVGVALLLANPPLAFNSRKFTDAVRVQLKRGRTAAKINLVSEGLAGLVEGKPTTLYHGNTALIQKFDLSQSRDALVNQFYGKGIFLTPSLKVAWRYAKANRNIGFPVSIVKEMKRKDAVVGAFFQGLVKEGDSAWYLEGPSGKTYAQMFADGDISTDLNTLNDIAGYVLGSKVVPLGGGSHLFSMSTGAPDWLYDSLDEVGLDSSKYRPKVYTVSVRVQNVLVTASKAEARGARKKGYDCVVYHGTGLVGGVPEVAVFDPKKAQIRSVKVSADKLSGSALVQLNIQVPGGKPNVEKVIPSESLPYLIDNVSVRRVAAAHLTRVARPRLSNPQLPHEYVRYLRAFEEKLKYNEARMLGDTADIWVRWREFYRTGQKWADYVIDHAAIPSRKAKGVEMAVRLFRVRYGRGKGPRPSIASWYRKHEKRFRLLVEAVQWSERSEEDGIFQHGPFRVHNTVGANDKDIQAAKTIMDRAVRALAKTELPGLKQMAYGNVYLVGQIKRKNWAAWYIPSKDAIYLRPKIRGQSSEDNARTLVHELTHRYWRKKLSNDLKTAWRRHHLGMLSPGKPRTPSVGETLPIRVNNKTVRLDSLEGGKATLVNVKDNKVIGSVLEFQLRNWMADAEQKMRFPSIYASGDYEEHFCEAVAHKGMGTLDTKNLKAFNEVVLGKGGDVAGVKLAAAVDRLQGRPKYAAMLDEVGSWGGHGPLSLRPDYSAAVPRRGFNEESIQRICRAIEALEVACDDGVYRVTQGPSRDEMADRVAARPRRAARVQVDIAGYSSQLLLSARDLWSYALRQHERATARSFDPKGLAARSRRWLGNLPALRGLERGDEKAINDVMNAIIDVDVDVEGWDERRKLFQELVDISTSSEPPPVESEYTRNADDLIKRTKAFAEGLAGQVVSATRRVREWGGRQVGVRAEIPQKDNPFQPATSYYVTLGGPRGPGFSVFLTDQGGLGYVDDVLEGGPELRDPILQSNYFDLIKELRTPGSSQKPGKNLVLYTARPTKDRALYDGARTVPTGIYLTDDAHRASGIAHDLGSSEVRDVWEVLINEVHLIPTLAGRVKDYQTVGRGSVPVRRITLYSEGRGRRASSVRRNMPPIPVRLYDTGAANWGSHEWSATSRAAKYLTKKEVPKTYGNGTTTVYEYSDGQIQYRNREKAKRIEKLRGSIHKLRADVKKDLTSKDDKVRLTALAVGLLDATYERVGNKGSAEDGHYGVTGWLVKHVKFGKGKATISYVGKSGVSHKKVVEDAGLVSALKYATRGKDSEGLLCSGDECQVKASDVNAYLKAHAITAKDIRGYHANTEVQTRLKIIRAKGGRLPSDPKEKTQKLKEEFTQALEEAAEAVGHKPATLKSQYLVPGMEENYLQSGKIVNNLAKQGSVERLCIQGLYRRAALSGALRRILLRADEALAVFGWGQAEMDSTSDPADQYGGGVLGYIWRIGRQWWGMAVGAGAAVRRRNQADAVNNLRYPRRVATKTKSEREDDEARRMSRPVPTKKPPRKDLRRNRMNDDDDNRDVGADTAETDKDRSLNYKKVGCVVRGFHARVFRDIGDRELMALVAGKVDKDDEHRQGDYWEGEKGWRARSPSSESSVAARDEAHAKAIAEGVSSPKDPKSSPEGKGEAPGDKPDSKKLDPKEQARKERARTKARLLRDAEDFHWDMGILLENLPQEMSRLIIDTAPVNDVNKGDWKEGDRPGGDPALIDAYHDHINTLKEVSISDDRGISADALKDAGVMFALFEGPKDQESKDQESKDQEFRDQEFKDQPQGPKEEKAKEERERKRAEARKKHFKGFTEATPQEQGELLARMQFAMSVVANPKMVGGRALGGRTDPGELTVRASEAARQYNKVSPGIRALVAKSAASSLRRMPEGSAESKEMNAIIDGLAIAAAANGESLVVEGKRLRPRMSSGHHALSKQLLKQGDESILFGALDDFYGPKGRAAVGAALNTMNDKDLASFSKDDGWGSLSQKLFDKNVSDDLKDWIRGFLKSQGIETMTSVQELIEASAAESGVSAEKVEKQFTAALLADKHHKRWQKKIVKAQLKGEDYDKVEQGYLQWRSRYYLDWVKTTNIKFPPDLPVIAKHRYIVETGDTTILKYKVERQKSKKAFMPTWV